MQAVLRRVYRASVNIPLCAEQGDTDALADKLLAKNLEAAYF
jgi:hypothetical protein